MVAINPPSKDSKYKEGVSRFGADIALVSVNHKDFNGAELLTHGDTKPFVISGPGDYEVKDIFINGVGIEAVIDGKKYINTIYSLTSADIKLTFLGALSSDIPANLRETIQAPDILFVPVGDGNLLSPKNAYKLAVSLEPKIIIPMDYDANSLKQFLKEGGEEKITPIEKLTIKKKDLEGKDAEIVVLK